MKKNLSQFSPKSQPEKELNNLSPINYPIQSVNRHSKKYRTQKQIKGKNINKNQMISAPLLNDNDSSSDFIIYEDFEQFKLKPMTSQNSYNRSKLEFDSIISSGKYSPQEYLKHNKITRLATQLAVKSKESGKEQFFFTPQSRFIIIWNFITVFVIYLYFMEIPITIAFQNHRSEQDTQLVFEIINIPALFIFITGTIIKLKTAYYDRGVLIFNQKQVIIHYFKNIFFFDFLSIGSIVIYQISEVFRKGPIDYRFIVLLFYLKISELINMEKYLIYSFDLNRRVKASLKLILLLTKIFLLCSIAACCFFYLSDNLCEQESIYQNCPECCWVNKITFNNKTLSDNPWNTQYVYSLYWASTTMISIGYGDITPQNPYQISYTIVIQFCSCLVFAYSLNEIWNIIQQLNSKKHKIRYRISTMNTYMRDKNINPTLKSKINAYLSHFYHKKNVRQKQLQVDIISQLTPSLKKELYFEAFGFIFRQNSFFKSFSAQLLQTASQKIQQIGYFEEEVVYSPELEEGCADLYYLMNGNLSNFIRLNHHSKFQIKKYFDKETIGLYQFVTQLNYRSYLTAHKYSLIYQLKFQDWKVLLIDQDRDFQIFYSISHKAITQKKIQKLEIQCVFCNSISHISQECLQSQIYLRTRHFLKRYKMKNERQATFKRQNVRSENISIKTRLKNMSSVIRQSFKNRKQSLDLSNFLRQHNKHGFGLGTQNKRHRRKQLKTHMANVEKLKIKISKQRQRQQRDQLSSIYSGQSQVLPTQNFIDKVQTYNFYHPEYNSCEQSYDATIKRRITNLNKKF